MSDLGLVPEVALYLDLSTIPLAVAIAITPVTQV